MFDGQRLSALQADSPSVRSVPPMYVAWLPKTSPLAYPTHMGVPLYSTPMRTKLLAQVRRA
jgi:dynein heavy chain 2